MDLIQIVDKNKSDKDRQVADTAYEVDD